MSVFKSLHENKLRIASLAVAVTMFGSVFVPTATVLAEEVGPNTDNSAAVTGSEVAEALRGTDGVLASSDQTAVTSDADSAIQAVTAGTAVDVPKDASEGVTLGAADGSTPAIDIALPNAETAGDAKQVAPGTVAYPSNNGSANAVQATEDGGVRMLTVIDNPNAPTVYDYKVTVPNGGHVELTDDGGAVVKDGAGETIASVATPWAKDATGAFINTYFTTDGLTLTQHIEHNVPSVVYPVTADPRFDWKWYGVNIYLSQTEVNRLLAVMATGGGFAAVGAAITGGTGGGALAFGIGGAAIAIGSGAIQWCSAKGRGMWVHYNYFTRMMWCNNG